MKDVLDFGIYEDAKNETKCDTVITQDEFIARVILEEDFSEFTRLWLQWSPIVLARDFYPTTGICVTDKNNNFIASCWVYETDSSVASLEWFVIDKEFKDREKMQEVWNLLFDKVDSYLKEIGIKFYHAATANPHLKNTLARRGYAFKDEGYTAYIKEI